MEKSHASHEETVPEEKKGFLAWVKEHKAQLILIGISVPTLIAIVAGIKNKDAIKEIWANLKEAIKKANMYSSSWFTKASLDELNIEREKVRLAYCSSGSDEQAATHFESLLRQFDKELSKRAWGNETPRPPSIHREHGWYLPNDD